MRKTLILALFVVMGLVAHAQSGIGGGSAATGGTASLPTSAAGQVLTNATGGPTGYAAQGQIYFGQTGDTVASIEAACSSLCTYIVTSPQTLTLAASHTLASNVQLDFRAGGKWTVNGAFTLTIAGNVTGTLNQHFAGTSTIKFGFLQPFANVEWFGATGDWNGTTGTDNTTAIQNTLNAITYGQALLQASCYKTTAALSIAKSYVGVKGTQQGGIAGAAVATASPSCIISTSATADILDVAGTDATHRLLYNRFENFAIERSVAPTSATAAGLSINYAAGAILNYVQSMDSGRDFYFHSAPGFSLGHVSHTWAGWGYNGVTETAGVQLSGYYLDSADGNAENSLTIDNSAATSPLATSVIAHGMDIVGTSINDVDAYLFGTGNMTIGVYVNYTGTGTLGTSSDLQFVNVTNDSFSQSGFSINGVVGTAAGSVNIVGGYDASATATGGAGILISSSSGVSVVNHQITVPADNASISATGSSNLTFSGNTIMSNPAVGLLYSGVTNSSFTGNTLSKPSAGTTSLVSVTSTSTYNSFTGNSLGGFATNGFLFDSSSVSNNESGNTINPANITNLVVDPSGTNTPSSGSFVKIAEQVLGTTAATITFSGIPGTYRNLRLVVNARTDNTNPNTGLQFNADAGSNYDTVIFQGTGTTVSAFTFNLTTAALLGNIAISTAPAGSAGSIDAMIYNYAGTTFWKNWTATNGYEQAASTFYSLANSGMWHSAAAITSMKLSTGAGNFVAGSTFTLYGMN